jgi:hypothetical protein
MCSLDASLHSEITGFKFCLLKSEIPLSERGEPQSPQLCMHPKLGKPNHHNSFMSYLS